MKFKGLLKVALLLVAVSALFVACDTLAGGRFPHVEKVYMKPGEDWASDNPSYAAWMWTDGKEGSWTELTKSTVEEGLWEVAVPSEIDNIIFVKMKDGTTKDKFSWDAKEEQTADLKVPYVFDKVEVYSIKAKEWIALGAEEKEPEKPVLEPVAISAAEFTSLKYAAQNNPNDIELDAEKSFTFYANSKNYKFKYTDGTWTFTAVTGEAITELDKEYPIVKKGDTGYDNIELNKLTAGAEYKVTLIHKDGFAYVKVVATGNTQTGPIIDINEIVYVKSNHGDAELVKNGNIATATITIKATSSWGDCGATELQFGIVKDNNWSVKYTGATITELNKKFDLVKGDGSNNKYSGVKAYEEYKITVDCLDGTVKLEKTKEAPAEITYVEKVYVKVEEDSSGNDWLDAEAWIIAYFWGNGDVWVEHTTEESGVYGFEVPTGSTGFKFVRMNPSASEGSWDNDKKWAETGNLSIPLSTDQNVVYTIKGWDSGSSWGPKQ